MLIGEPICPTMFVPLCVLRLKNKIIKLPTLNKMHIRLPSNMDKMRLLVGIYLASVQTPFQNGASLGNCFQ